jgi:hypothetical protein
MLARKTTRRNRLGCLPLFLPSLKAGDHLFRLWQDAQDVAVGVEGLIRSRLADRVVQHDAVRDAVRVKCHDPRSVQARSAAGYFVVFSQFT